MAKEVSNATSQVQSEESVAPVDQAKSAQISFLMDAGAQYTDEGEYAEAERAYLRALENSPDNPAICFHLSTLYIQMGRFADAAKLLKELTEKFPDNPMVQNNLSWIYASSETMKNGKLALLHAREALLSAPAAPSVWNTLAEAYYVSGQYDQALQASKQALELLRLQKTSETELAAFEAQSAKIQRAAEAYKKLMGLDNQE
ncbi:MAG: tetratricopeptide repeat protein [Kiritimatiellales bacterium]